MLTEIIGLCGHQSQRVEVKKLKFSSSKLAESTACYMYVMVLTETLLTVVSMKKHKSNVLFF